MRTKDITLTFAILLLSFFSFTQTTTLGFLYSQYNSIAICDSITIDISPIGFDNASNADINFKITGTNLLNKNYTATVTWSDNSTTTHTGLSVSANTSIIWTPAITKNISVTGLDTLQIQLVEDNSTNSTLRIIGYNSNICEKIYFNSNIDCNGDGILDDSTVYIIPYLYNATDTIYSIYGGTDSTYYFPDTLSGQFTTGFNYGWNITPLISISPTTITFPITGNIPVIDLVFTCNYQSCIQGIAFCDDNNDGLYDTLTENPISNMPINGLYSPYQSSVSDSNGVINMLLGSQNNNYQWGYSLSLVNSWLDSMGYYSSTQSIFLDSSYLDQNCANNASFGIPITCNLTSVDSVCFEGVVYKDLNFDGVKNSNEPTIPGLPMHSYIDGVFHNLASTGANGEYSYTGVKLGGADSVMLQVNQFYLNNPGNNIDFLSSDQTYVQNFECNGLNVINFPIYDTTANSIFNLTASSNNNYLVCDTLTLSISPMGMDTLNNEDIDVYFTGINLLNQNYTLIVDWGDNSSSTHTGTSTNANQAITWTPALAHHYPIDSTYHVSINLVNASNQDSLQQYIGTVNSGICPQYTMFLNSLLDCNNDSIMDGYINVLPFNYSNYIQYYTSYQSIHLYNATDTIYPDTMVYAGWGNFYRILLWPENMPSGTYSLGYSQAFLQANDLVLASGVSNIVMPNNGTIQTVNSIFNCIQNQICLSGYLYCDDNGNGILDSTENTIPNAPITTNSNIEYIGSFSDNDTTDANGYYSIPFTVYDSANFSLIIDQNWLTAAGYIGNNSYNYTYSIYLNNDSIFDCNTDLNIPIICNPNATDSICVSGQLFCDVNNNGILDGNETVIPNAPVTLSLNNNGGVVTLFTDSLGNYFYHNYHPNTDSLTVTIPSYWLANNGYNTPAAITVSTLDCSIDTDIAIDCNIPLPCDNTWINIFGAGPYYQNWTNTMALTFGNSNYTFPGSVYTISITIPNGSTLDTGAFNVSNYTLNGNLLTWTQTINNFDSLLIDFNIAAGIPDSTLHNYTASITGMNTDCDSTNNVVNYTAIVGSSYDPNNKLVNLPQYINAGMQEELIYTINFQNTGTAPAQDVRIEDEQYVLFA